MPNGANGCAAKAFSQSRLNRCFRSPAAKPASKMSGKDFPPPPSGGRVAPNCHCFRKPSDNKGRILKLPPILNRGLPANHSHAGFSPPLVNGGIRLGEMALIKFNPKTKIKMGRLRPDIGAETIWKSRSHTRRGLVRLFPNRLCPSDGCRVTVIISVFGFNRRGGVCALSPVSFHNVLLARRKPSIVRLVHGAFMIALDNID